MSETQIESELAALEARFGERASACTSELELRNIRAEVLGKKGELTAVLRGMGSLPADKRPQVGERANRTRDAIEAAFAAALERLKAGERKRELEAAPYDLTLPGRVPFARGHMHPITQVKNELLDVARSLGFAVAWGPEVDSESNNFTKLAFPPDHPATDMQDTFWVDAQNAPPGVRLLLRTHTSTVQIREMSSRKPPMAIVSAGTVYRRDDDVTHSPMFNQIEGFLVDENVSFAELRGILTEFARRLYGSEIDVRFRPAYFPFVEPGAELDVSCVFCTPTTRSSCRVCKSSGWLEVLGCGMIHPEVFRHCGIDPERYTGFAFGMGVDRVAMLRYGIPEIRLLFENDPRFISQF